MRAGWSRTTTVNYFLISAGVRVNDQLRAGQLAQLAPVALPFKSVAAQTCQVLGS